MIFILYINIYIYHLEVLQSKRQNKKLPKKKQGFTKQYNRYEFILQYKYLKQQQRAKYSIYEFNNIKNCFVHKAKIFAYGSICMLYMTDNLKDRRTDRGGHRNLSSLKQV